MKQTMKKSIALLLVLVQIFVLFPVLQPQAQAAQTDPETPALNKTIVGTVNFQSFNFLGDNDTGEDGTDYSTTFYYTDDYFAPSAINDAATSRTMLWSDLDNPSLAACSMDFAVASYTSAEGDVIRSSSQTWNNTDYDGTKGKADPEYGKAVNAINFLTDCKFTNIEPHALNERPSNDSIGYTLGSKEITVWNAETQKNETYTLIAVGVRGAGYGAEWASNITIGDPATGAIGSNGRHYGFDHSAQIVCQGIQNYLSSHGITGNVKYWVSGFSRAAAVANLVAGYLTDNVSTYKTQQKDVFGYTWECPQAASTIGENALDYKNIHNILNPMDAVPKVSPSDFEHQRLGVDYQMPYHGTPNLSTATHTALYNQMFEVLKTIAVGNGTDPDPLVDNKDTSTANDGYVSPDVYPYKSKMTIYKMKGTQLFSDALSGNLMTNFGTVVASGNLDNSSKLLGRSDGGWYIDQFIDNLIKVFLTSNAWIGGTGNNRTAIQNRATFIKDYQGYFRTLMGYFLDFSGPAFMDMVDKLTEAITDQFKISNAGFGLAFLNFYNDPTGSYTGISNLAYRFTSWWGKAKKDVLISEAKSVAVDTANSLTSGFTDPQGITRTQMNSAMENVVGLVINLYAYELDAYESQYLGTTLRYLNTILCTHEQETVLSWIMSVDPNHINRSCRTLTVPSDTDVTLYEFRTQYGETPTDLETTAPVVAEIHDGAFIADTLKDQRITLSTSGSSVTIRYPASLELRADVKAASDVNLNAVNVKDYQTKAAATKISDGAAQFSDGLPTASYNNVTNTSATNAQTIDTDLTGYGTLEAGDTLHVLVNDIQTFNSDGETTTYNLSIDKAPDITVLDYGTPGGNYTDGTDLSSAVSLGIDTTVSTNTLSNRTILTRQKQITVPASSVYYDDELTGNSTSSYESDTTRLDTDTEGKTVWYKFRGTRIDAYCTTDDTAGYVQAAVTDESGNIVTNAAGERMIVTMKSASDTTRYNVPTISFDGLNSDTDYYLKITALKGANYRLDGIRVYHSADETDAAVQTAYESVGEQDAKYVNLRALLLGSVSEETLSGDDANIAEGALFYTDSGTSYALTSDEYKTNSPKNEIYLKAGESVAFQIVGTYEKVAVGMSAPESKTGGGSVTVTDGSGTKTQPIANALDQYYEITPAPDGSVVITNPAGSTAMISITNVKLSGDYTAPVSGQSLDVPLTVSKSLIRYAASFSTLADTTPAETAAPEETVAPTEEPIVTPTPESTPSPTPSPEPTPTPTTSVRNIVQQLISSYVKSLFDGFSRLFRP